MNVIKNLFRIIWRVWFYILIIVPILIFAPLLIVSLLKESWYPMYFRIAQCWARIVLYGMGFMPDVKYDERFEKNQSYMLVANHTSMTDIMLMLHLAKNPFVFVGKAELAKLPIFGFFYKRSVIMVDRKDAQSRKAVFDQAQRKLDAGYGICIFPEGGVPNDKNIVLDRFKDGAFRLAIQYQIPIVPIVFYDNKKRFSFDFFSGSPGRMRARVHAFMATKGAMKQDKVRFRESVRTLILDDLTQGV